MNLPPAKVWAGVLAAGEGRRMGSQPKALLEIGARTFLETIATTARQGGAAGVAVVVGYHAAAVEPLARELCDVVVHNPTPERGMASSARALAAALPPDTAMLLWPVDMPAIGADTVRAVIAAAAASPGRCVTPTTGDDAPGHPPFLPPALVADIAALGDEQRLDHFIAARCGEPVAVHVDDPGILRDVDSPPDLEAL